MSVRKREWKTTKGEPREGWSVDYRDQKGHRVIKLFKFKKEAAAYHAKVTVEVNDGIHTVPSRSITLKEAAADWIRSGEADGLERATLDAYRQHVNHILPRFPTMKLGYLRQAHVEKFREGLLLDGMSKPMARKVLASLKSILYVAKRRGNVAVNVATDVKIKRDDRERRNLKIGVDIPTLEEIAKIIAKLEGRWEPFFLVAIFTGLRASELRGLRWKDVEPFDKNELRVEQRVDRWGTPGKPKSHAGTRAIPLGPDVVQALRKWRLKLGERYAPEGLVFGNRAGKPEDYTNIIERVFKPLQVAAGVTTKSGKAKYPGLHTLRHFYASWCINREADGGLELPLKVVQARLGHSTITMTADIYGHLFPRNDDGQELAAAERSIMARALALRDTHT
jgi:integrase